jgi:hypothetical protein
MRFRRLFLASLAALLLLGLLAIVWWWAVWPDRTAEQFAALLATGRVAEARAMMTLPVPVDPEYDGQVFVDDGWDMSAVPSGSRLSEPPSLYPRTLVDMLYARRRFRVPAIHFELIAERGTVSYRSRPPESSAATGRTRR